MIDKFHPGKSSTSLLIAGLFCLILYAVGIYCRPVFPVDETRYLTVAWEMHQSGDWILPRLNTEAYDHKPPLLFWTINLLWAIFGVSQAAAMAVPFLFAFAFVFVTNRFARKLRPDDKAFPALVTYLLIGSLPFMVYSNIIMFDLALGIFAVLGLTAIWDYHRSGQRKHLCLFALSVGLGAITKGPVILLHTIFPILFYKFWRDGTASVSYKKWAVGFGLAILSGAALGLCWAIPAAIKGGPDFAHKIFLGQTAGRITDSFAHKAPIWWYLEFLPLILAPWVFSPVFWRGLKTLKSADQTILKFLGIWLLPVFAAFSLISGKQVHYLLPLIPGFAIFTALIFRPEESGLRTKDAVIPFVFTGTLILLPFFLKLIAPEFARVLESPLLMGILDKVSLTIPLSLFILSALLVITQARKSIIHYSLILSLTSLMTLVCFQLEARDGLFKNFNLTPLAEVIRKNPDAPLAFARNYNGEWGFLARLDRKVEPLDPIYLPDFFKKHPDGMAFMRTSDPTDLLPYDVIFSMPYKMDKTYNIVVKRGQAERFSK